MSPNSYNVHAAIQDFQAARRRASIQDILARLRGKSTQLLSYDEVADKLKLRVRAERGTKNIPLDSIVGSVGRYTDFTRTFLPRRNEDLDRWARVKAAMEEDAGLPPIEVYQVGGIYFVIDGNHRVSIARQLGSKTIEAHVIEVKTHIPLTPDIQADDLIIKAEYADFLDVTHIMDLRPNVDLSVTIPGQYEKLMGQICSEECLVEENGRDELLLQAVEDWYDNTYLPLAETIRDRGMLRWFPGRTITDLYIWISENRAALERELGWEIQSDIAATDLILERGVQSEPGSWRKARITSRYTDHLFNDILVPLSGEEKSWASLEQAILIAQRENASIHGLHVVSSKEKVQRPEVLEVQAQFHQRCVDADVHGSLAIELGDITEKINERAAATDLIVLKIDHPPAGGLSKFTSAFRTIITNSSSPVLGVPEAARKIERTLLAYDGSPLAKEALFVATYFAEIWKTKLFVFTALDGTRIKPDVQDYVRRYLELHEVEAKYFTSELSARDRLRNIVEDYEIDLVLMGSYGASVVRQIFIGSTVDTMLRESLVPIFICR